MQIINHWPTNDEIALPEAVIRALINALVEPFASENEARAFWHECPSTIIVLNENTVAAELDIQARKQVSFCVSYPEFEDVLPDGYRLLLAIVNDEGAGCYLVLPSELDMSEVLDG